MARFIDEETRGFPLTGGDSEPTAAEIAQTRREAWDVPFLADPSDEAANAARGEQTRELAAAILAVPLMTSVGGMTVASAGWS
jgi:hypothetical protein